MISVTSYHPTEKFHNFRASKSVNPRFFFQFRYCDLGVERISNGQKIGRKNANSQNAQYAAGSDEEAF